MNVAVIPARGGSKGIPGKNMMMIGGKPLIFYSMQVAIDSPLVDLVVVTSDDKDILEYAESFGASTAHRDSMLASDDAPTEPCIRDAIRMLNYIDDDLEDLKEDDNVVMLQPTSPLRTVAILDECINRYHRMIMSRYDANGTTCDAIFTAHNEKYYHWNLADGKVSTNVHWNKYNEVAFRPSLLQGKWQGDGFNYMAPRVCKQNIGNSIRENGSIYITSVRNWIFYNRFGLDPYPFIIPPICGMELDYPWQIPIFNHIIENNLHVKEIEIWLGA